MSFNFDELLIMGKLIGNKCNGKVLTEIELEGLAKAFKREIDLRTDFTDQKKEALKLLVDVAKEQSKRV